MAATENICVKCGAKTTNFIVCDSCNLPPEGTRYYRYSSEYGGECFFRVRGTGQDVLQIVTQTNAKRGNYKKGVYFIRYNSFIGNKGWKLNESKFTKEINKAEFDDVLERVTNQFRDTPLITSEQQTEQQTTPKKEIRRYAQSIVSSTINDINNKADQIPDDVSIMKEQDLLDAIIDELKNIRGKK